LFDRYASEFNAFVAKPGHTVTVAGDFDGDRHLTLTDVDQLAMAIRNAVADPKFDFTHDGVVTLADQESWVHDLKHTWFGDADLNGEFNSADLVQVLAAGKYEAPQGAISWYEGDWNADGLFNSTDLVDALADGGYEQGPRLPAAAVPEPSGLLLVAGPLPLVWVRSQSDTARDLAA
jgi:hypothetical protein